MGDIDLILLRPNRSLIAGHFKLAEKRPQQAAAIPLMERSVLAAFAHRIAHTATASALHPEDVRATTGCACSGRCGARDRCAVGLGSGSDDSGRLDLHQCPILEQVSDDDQRHRWIVIADDFTVDGADLARGREVLLFIHDVPG